MTPTHRARIVPIKALQLDMPVSYEKWGGIQNAKSGDWLIFKGGEIYSCDRQVFEDTYRPLEGGEKGQFYKDACIEAHVAEAGGTVATLEGTSAFEAGDYIVTNPGGDMYVIRADKFHLLYEGM